MRKTIQFLQLAFILLLATACAETSPFKYESVPNDPLKARIYTLVFHIKKSDTGPFRFFQHIQRTVNVHVPPYVVLLRTVLSVYPECFQTVGLLTGAKIIIK